MSIEERLDFEQAIERLTARQRLALYLVCYLSYTQEEAAATLGITQAAVSGRIARARGRIVEVVGAEML